MEVKVPNPYDLEETIPIINNKVMVNDLEMVYGAKPAKAHKKQVTVSADHFTRMMEEQGYVQHLIHGAVPESVGHYIPPVYLIANISAVVSTAGHASGGGHRREVVTFPLKIPGRFYAHDSRLPGGQKHSEHSIYDFLASGEGIKWFCDTLTKQLGGVDGRKVYGFTLDIAENKSMCDKHGYTVDHRKPSCAQRMLHYQHSYEEGPLKDLADALIGKGFVVSATNGLRVTTRTAEHENVVAINCSSWALSDGAATRAASRLSRWGRSLGDKVSRDALLEVQIAWAEAADITLPDMAGRTVFVTRNGKNPTVAVHEGKSVRAILRDRFEEYYATYKTAYQGWKAEKEAGGAEELAKKTQYEERRSELVEYTSRVWKDIIHTCPLAFIGSDGHGTILFKRFADSGIGMHEQKDGDNLLIQAIRSGQRRTATVLVPMLDPRERGEDDKSALDLLKEKVEALEESESESLGAWTTLYEKVQARAAAIEAGEIEPTAAYDRTMTF
jgi:hypothetical protein